MKKISVLVVEDHATTRVGLRVELSQELDIDVVDVAATASEAVEKCVALRPQVVLLDLHLPDSNGPKSLIATFVPLAKVVVFSAEGSKAVIRKIMEMGAAGFVSKSDSTAVLLVAIRSAVAVAPTLVVAPPAQPVSHSASAATDLPAPHHDFEDQHIGKIIDERYRVNDVLGSGSYSVVYRATDLAENRQVALKILHPHLAMMRESSARLEREATICMRLNHPNIATTYSCGVTSIGQPYLALEYLSGVTLDRELEDKGPMPGHKVVFIIQQLCAGLAAAHSIGVVHRDIKPANIHVATGNAVKILDFGLVKAVSGGPTEMAALTASGETIGTPCYMSPEQCRGEELDARSDLYAVGCLMSEMLTGEVLFQGNTVVEVLMNHISSKPNLKSLTTVNAPKELILTIEKTLQKDPHQRFQSAEALGNRLGQISFEDESKKFPLFKNWP